jgi:hypothetical protein
MAVLALAVGMGGMARAQPDYVPAAELLQRGHAAYEAGRFDEAIEAYQRAERAGVRNGALYYDLGNAWYKSGDLGQAIACYRRAEMLSPRDPLLRANLEFVLARREDKAVQPPDFWLVARARGLFRWLSLNEWIGVAALLYVLACGAFVLRLVRRGRSRLLDAALYACTGLLLLVAVVVGFKVHAVRGVQRGVVAPSRIAVMSGPGQDYTTEFSLHEGAEVRIEVRRPDWLRISVGGQLRGWVPAESIIQI